ncbi:UNVERIFIED_CONTAM: hypothetical protein Sangu_1743400 [Sesamum angustifolium]|uniref:Uncharacterized protein n=1 Tax=Sesamum angustifolium TaxID=2727405 RepID=A0AAW2M593_9LAMI
MRGGRSAITVASWCAESARLSSCGGSASTGCGHGSQTGENKVHGRWVEKSG